MTEDIRQKIEMLERYLIYCPNCKKTLMQDSVDKTLIHCGQCNKSYWLKKVKKNE